MAAGSWNGAGRTPAHPTAYCKVKLGWVNPIVITNGEQDITLKPYALDDGQIYKLPIGTANNKEYFLLSNRKKMGFDSQLQGEGFIIEHIDEEQTSNTDETHYLVDIEQADGRQDLNKNANRGDASDPFPYNGNNRFGVGTTPNSKSYAGTDSKIEVTNIQYDGDNITAHVSVGDPKTVSWIYNKKVRATFVHHTSQYAYVNLETLGWKQIKNGSADGVTNILNACCTALAHGREIHAYVDNTYLYTMYLL